MNERRYEVVLMEGARVITRYGATFTSPTDARTQAASLNDTLDMETFPFVCWLMRQNPRLEEKSRE